MTAKEYLKQLKKINVMIRQRTQEKEMLCAALGSIGSFDYSKDRVRTSPSGDAQYAKTVEKIVDLEKEIDNLIIEFLERMNKIISQIQSLKNDKYVEILYKHYVEGKQLGAIAKEMGYAHQYIISLHTHALKEFEKVLDFSKNHI